MLLSLLRECGVVPESEEFRRLSEYIGLVGKWNPRVNLTGSLSGGALFTHLREAVWASQLYCHRGARHLDIGSGGGLPAIPIKILNPTMRLTMLEPREKRAFFLEVVIRELGLSDCRVVQLKLLEYLEVETAGSFETVSWKGLRLTRPSWSLLLEKSAIGVEYWLFHGARLPVDDPEAFLKRVCINRQHAVPERRNSYLSVFSRVS